jgi:hypothetical protein
MAEADCLSHLAAGPSHRLHAIVTVISPDAVTERSYISMAIMLSGPRAGCGTEIMRAFIRFLSSLALVAALIALTNDLTHSWETGASVTFASLGKNWFAVSPGTLNLLQTVLERHVAKLLWDPVMLTLLHVPAFAAFAALALALFALTIRRRRVNIFAN